MVSTGLADEKLTPLRVQASWINDSEFIGYFVGMANGYYREVGLAIDHIPGHAGLVPETCLLDGSADIALTSPDSLATTIGRTGADLVIIGAQFQRNPLGIVSLAGAPVATLADLAGKVIAVPDANRAMLIDLIQQQGLDPTQTRFVPYAHETHLLADGAVDAFVDFVVDGPYALSTRNLETSAVLLFDLGAPLFNNVVVVRRSDLLARRQVFVRWLAASRRGWAENARDITHYPKALREDWLEKSRSLAHETFANKAFSALTESEHGYFAMTPADILAVRSYLQRCNTPLAADVFDASLLDEI